MAEVEVEWGTKGKEGTNTEQNADFEQNLPPNLLREHGREEWVMMRNGLWRIGKDLRIFMSHCEEGDDDIIERGNGCVR